MSESVFIDVEKSLDESDLSREQAFAYFGYIAAMLEIGELSHEEFAKLRKRIPLKDEDVQDIYF